MLSFRYEQLLATVDREATRALVADLRARNDVPAGLLRDALKLLARREDETNNLDEALAAANEADDARLRGSILPDPAAKAR